MIMSRFTVEHLRARVDEFNSWLTDAGALVRFEVSNHNGYMAVDEYMIDTYGNRFGKGINRTVGSGNPKGAYNEAHLSCIDILKRIEQNNYND